jgi:uncharacterized protein (DUF58 family)
MPVRSQQRFLLPEVVAQLATMEMRAATVVEGVMSGLHRSPFRGMSIEFAEYRRYQPGDDLRRIDWRAYARSDRYYIKEFEDETNLDATLVLDASASMGFGSGAMTKWQYAGTLAASLAYLLQRQQDNVGLVVLDEVIRLQREARNTRGHLIRVIGELEHSQPARQTRLADVLHQVAVRTKRHGMTIVISDLLDEPEAVVSALRHIQFSGGDVVVLHILDGAELGLNFEGPMRFIDPETNGMVSALAQDVRKEYLAAIGQFLNHYREELGKTNIAYSLVDTSAPLDHALLAFLGVNARRVS